jgi:hypothetical protein
VLLGLLRLWWRVLWRALRRLLGEVEDKDISYSVPAKKREELGAPPRTFDRYSFALSIKNTGPITIRDCLLEVRVEGLLLSNGTGRMATPETQEPRFFRMGKPQNPAEKHDGTIYGAGGTLYEEKIFPGQERHFPGATLTLEISRGSVETATLIWTLYLKIHRQFQAQFNYGSALAMRSNGSRVNGVATGGITAGAGAGVEGSGFLDREDQGK